MMERSLALKSPSIHYHLAGTKKVPALDRSIIAIDYISSVGQIFLSRMFKCCSTGAARAGQAWAAGEVPGEQHQGG